MNTQGIQVANGQVQNFRQVGPDERFASGQSNSIQLSDLSEHMLDFIQGHIAVTGHFP